MKEAYLINRNKVILIKGMGHLVRILILSANFQIRIWGKMASNQEVNINYKVEEEAEVRETGRGRSRMRSRQCQYQILRILAIHWGSCLEIEAQRIRSMHKGGMDGMISNIKRKQTPSIIITRIVSSINDRSNFRDRSNKNIQISMKIQMKTMSNRIQAKKEPASQTWCLS